MPHNDERVRISGEETGPGDKTPGSVVIFSVVDHCDLHRREHRRVIRQLQRSLRRMQYRRIAAPREVA